MITLDLPQNYAWKKLLALYNHSHCLEPTEYSSPQRGLLEGIVELPKPFWYRIEQKGGVLELTLTAPDGAYKPTHKDYEAARIWASRRFWLNLDTEAMRNALEVNFLGHSLSSEFWPVVSPAYTRYWAALLRIYCGRRFDLALRKNLGSKVRFGGQEYALLPTPAQMLAVNSLGLQSMGLSRWSSQKLPHITQAFLHDEAVQPENLPGDPEEALRRIHKRFGLGRTSAAWVLMRATHHFDVALEGNHIRRTLAEGLGLGGTPNVKEYLKLMQVHAPYRSFASYYLHLAQLKLWRKDWSLAD